MSARSSARSRWCPVRASRNPPSSPARASCRPASPRSTRSSGRAAFPGRPASPCVVTGRAARRPSPSAWPQRPRPRVRSSPGSTSGGASIRSRRLPAASACHGSSSSRRRTSTRACRSPAHSSAGGPSISSSSTCLRASVGRRSRRRSPTASIDSSRSPVGRAPSSSCSSRPAEPRVPSGPPSPSRPGSASSSPVGRGSGSGGMSSDSGRRW